MATPPSLTRELLDPRVGASLNEREEVPGGRAACSPRWGWSAPWNSTSRGTGTLTVGLNLFFFVDADSNAGDRRAACDDDDLIAKGSGSPAWRYLSRLGHSRAMGSRTRQAATLLINSGPTMQQRSRLTGQLLARLARVVAPVPCGGALASVLAVPRLRARWRAVVTALCSQQRQYITVKRLDAVRPARGAATPPSDVECVVLDSRAAVRALAPEIPSAFRDSADDLERRVAAGCVVCMARHLGQDGAGGYVVGYELAERGVFSALGHRVAMAADVVFSHWCEVIPAYRGRRIHGLLFATRDAYFRARGVTIVCGVCDTQNRASLRALARDGAVVVGDITRVSLAGGALVWETPWELIEGAVHAGRLADRDTPDAGWVGAAGTREHKTVLRGGRPQRKALAALLHQRGRHEG